MTLDAECCYAECCYAFFKYMPSVVMPSFTFFIDMPSAPETKKTKRLNVVMKSVVAP